MQRLIILLAIGVISLNFCAGDTKTATFGEPCNSTTPCESSNLICSSNQTCECDSKLSVYEPTTERCHLKLGSTCNSSSLCPRYAACRNPKSRGNGHRLCLCDDLHFQNSNDTCVPKGLYGAVCNSNGECRESKNLICIEGTCKCDNDSLYNSTRNQCLLLVNATCKTIIPNRCVENARCGHSIRQGCVCNEGYFQTVERTCQKFREVDEECSEDIRCVFNPKLPLSCQDGRCKCLGKSMLYDKVRKVCVMLLGEECRYNYECAGNSRCSGGKCSCSASNDIPHLSRKYCVGGHSSRCNATVKCAEETGLVCRNGRCECQLMDHKLYDQKTKKCLSLVGGPCDNSSLECVPNAGCVLEDGRGQGTCRCDSGFVPVDRQCDLGYGEQCKQSSYNDYGSKEPRCDRLGPLYCINGTCRCGAYQYYDKEMLRCRGLVGSTCKLSEEEFCVEGAICKGFRPTESVEKAGGLCECEDGFLKDGEGRCLSKDLS